jgi:hypothetical protein
MKLYVEHGSVLSLFYLQSNAGMAWGREAWHGMLCGRETDSQQYKWHVLAGVQDICQKNGVSTSAILGLWILGLWILLFFAF